MAVIIETLNGLADFAQIFTVCTSDFSSFSDVRRDHRDGFPFNGDGSKIGVKIVLLMNQSDFDCINNYL